MIPIRPLLLAIAVVLALQSTASLAQAPAPAARKVAVINSGYFYGDDSGKGGITGYGSAIRQLEIEFKPAERDIGVLAQRLAALGAEIDTLRVQNPAAPVLKVKVEQHEMLAKDLSRKTDDAKAAFERRQKTLVLPIQQKVSTALQGYLTGRGYTDVVDLADINTPKPPAGAIDETANFIAWYNSAPR